MNSNRIFVFVERTPDKSFKKTSKGLIGKAYSIKKNPNDEIFAILFDDCTEKEVQELSAFGTDKVIIVPQAAGNYFFAESYAKRYIELINKYKPNILLFTADNNGQALASRISGELRQGLVSSCSNVILNEKKDLLFLRPSYGDNLMSTVVSNSPIKMATIQPAFEVELNQNPDMSVEIFESKSAKFEKLPLMQLLSQVQTDKSIEAAKIIVAGGRGLGNLKGFEILRELADLLEGQVAGSRPVVNMGWISSDCQVGQTGKTISPSIYIAVGISGAMHHISGMRQSKCIIAINTSKYAPILEIADYSIIGDYQKVLPHFIEKIKEVKNRK